MITKNKPSRTPEDGDAEKASLVAFLPGGNWQPDFLGTGVREPGIDIDARGEAVLPPLEIQSKLYGFELRFVGESPAKQTVQNTVQTQAVPNIREIA
ncbi:MAG: hypothetical protein M3Q70_02100 [bacterium]|nr:hypothetical protein [bacterium]